MSALLQIFAQFLEIIDLAIKDHDDAAVFIVDWLITGLQIDDGQPPMSQAALIIYKKAFSVRAAVCDPFGHCFQYFRLYIVFTDISCNPAHGFLPASAVNLFMTSRSALPVAIPKMKSGIFNNDVKDPVALTKV